MHSQNGEDGVIAEIFRRIGTTNKTFVEFGVEDGREAMCVVLATISGWNGLFMEGAPDKHAQLQARYAHMDRIKTREAMIYPHNLEEILAEEQIPLELDLLSIDIDSNDWYVWESLTDYKPRLVIIEYNAQLPLDSRLVMPYDSARAWDGTDYYGASLGAMELLGEQKGYELIHTEQCGVNAFFLRKDLNQGRFLTGAGVPRCKANHFHTGHGHPRDPHDRPWVDLSGDGEHGLVRLSEMNV